MSILMGILFKDQALKPLQNLTFAATF